ncbi:hypothetical protein DJ62_2696 [Yersinia enterocolitica]|nr:hypothetical protein DJ62_2696 [Yersinia enterocolitica]
MAEVNHNKTNNSRDVLSPDTRLRQFFVCDDNALVCQGNINSFQGSTLGLCRLG